MVSFKKLCSKNLQRCCLSLDHISCNLLQLESTLNLRRGLAQHVEQDMSRLPSCDGNPAMCPTCTFDNWISTLLRCGRDIFARLHPMAAIYQMHYHNVPCEEIFFFPSEKAEISLYNSWALSGWDSRHLCCRWFARRISTVDDALQDCKDFAAIFVTSAVQCTEAS